MRLRSGIETDLCNHELDNLLIGEILLDIRDLLIKINIKLKVK
jgi:hypothetical protein